MIYMNEASSLIDPYIYISCQLGSYTQSLYIYEQAWYTHIDPYVYLIEATTLIDPYIYMNEATTY